MGKLTGDHLFSCRLKKLTGAKFTQVPYSGSKAIPALLSSEHERLFPVRVPASCVWKKTRRLLPSAAGNIQLCPTCPFIEQGCMTESANIMSSPPQAVRPGSIIWKPGWNSAPSPGHQKAVRAAA